MSSLVGLFDHLTPPPRPTRARLRRKPESEYLHVRRVRGPGSFQSRVWLGVHRGGSLNLGLFTMHKWETAEHAEWAAARASRQFCKRFKPGVTLRAVIESLVADELIPDHVLPPRVKATADGKYVGRVKLHKPAVLRLETAVYECPWAAYDEMLLLLAAHKPKKPPTQRALRMAQRADRVTLADWLNAV